MHGGAAPQVRRKAKERVVREAALEQGRRLGGVIDVDPHEAILSALQEAAANVAVLRGLVAAHEVGEVPAGILGMYEDERERLVKFAKLALDAGVPERRVRVAQEEAHQLARAFERALDAFAQDISPAMRDSLKRALGAELRAIVRENEHARQRDREALEAHIGSLRLRIDGE
jgi:hypothetical protein